MTTARTDTSVHATRNARWAAAFLGIGALLFVTGIVFGLAAFAGEWDRTVGATLPATAAIIRDKWTVFRRIWLGEMCAALLIAVAAFLLQHNPRETARRVPLGLLWIVVGIGSILVAVQYAFTLGSYPPALASFEQEPALFAAIRGGVLTISAVGSILQLGGILLILLVKLRLKSSATSDRLVQVAVAGVMVGLVLATIGLIPGEFGAAAVFMAAALLGSALWLRESEMANQPQAESNSAA